MWKYKLLAFILVICFTVPPVITVEANRTRGVFLSGLRVDYDGVDERSYKNTPSFNDDDSGTWCAWINHDTTFVSNDFEAIFGLGGSDTDQATAFGRVVIGVRYATSQDNVLEIIQVSDGGTTNRVGGSTKLNGETNYLTCISSNSSDWDFYVNGNAETENTISGSNNGNWFNDVGTVGTRRAGIGDVYRDGVWLGSNFDGKIDNIMIWNTELTSTQISTLYNSGKPIHPCALNLCSNLDTFIKMGESDNGTITTLYDSDNANNFTSDNMENADIVTTSYY